MKWILSVLIVVSLYNNTFARDIFVGGAGASDSNPGTNTQPFATIQKAASVAVAGDVVNIRAGTYRETIVPANSGVTYRNDNGATVTISGLNEVTTPWTVHRGQIYKTTVTLPVSNNISTSDLTSNTTIMANQVFKDGTMMHLARWPKVSTPEDLLDRNKFRYHRQTVSLTNTRVVDNGLPATGNLAGAHINILGWFFTQTRQITARSGNTITYPAVSDDLHFVKWYYITNHIDLLTQDKEWFYSGGILYFWQNGGGSPTGVEYKARNWAFDLRGKSNITITGLSFIGCEPMTGNVNSNSIILDNIRAKYTNHTFTQQGGDLIYRSPRMNGMKLIGSNCIVRNSEFKYSASQLIWAGPNCLVENNLASDIGYEGNYGAFVTPYTSAGGVRILRNTVSRVCRSAVDFGCDGPIQGGAAYGGTGSHLNMEIGYNIFHTFLMLNTDGGAIYGARGLNLTGTVVHHNWIYDNTVGGLWLDHGVKPYDWHGSHSGIYYDQGSGPTTNHHNVLWNGGSSDSFNQILFGRISKWYNNTYASTAPQTRESYCTYYNTPNDIHRNNIFMNTVNINWGGNPGNIANCILKTTDPKFVGPLKTGLGYKLQSTSPAINAGVIIPGITDGSVGAPDIGAYEFGAPDWIPGYTPVRTTTPQTNTSPTGSITAPSNNTSFAQGTPINITATAADANGTVTRVEFFDGTTKLGEDTSSPYSLNWTNAAAGTHTLTIRVTDNENATATSTAVTITVTANASPTVSITAPSNNAQVTAGTPISITATAADANGTVAKVEFFDGTTKLGEDLSSPYAFAWTNAAAGAHVLTARATDNQNNVTTSTAVNITVAAANASPTVAITSPANSAQVTSGSTITITATAADANGSVTKVEFFDGTTKLGEDLASPYSFAWTNATAGSHALTARATDNQNNVTTSATVNITVAAANTPPTAAITSPSNNSQLTSGSSITITATATDVNGSVTKVEFFNGTTKLGEDLSRPYSFIWNNAAPGAHTLTVKATDNQNNVTTSAAVNITLVSPNTAPTVSITGPAANTQFPDGAPVTITATAADANGSVAKVEFFAGNTKLGEDVTNTYSFTWNNIPSGTHIITVKATDNQNNVTTSSSITIVVGNANVAPLVSIAAPLENSEFTTGSSISIEASASDSDGSVTKVEFFNGTTKLGEDLTTPYTFIWNNVPEGSYSLNAVATDNENAVTTSESIAITVTNTVGNPAAGGVEDLYSGIPRFFSPNDDGTGDYWEWTQPELFANSLLTVFNRSGQKVFEALSYNNTWDGKQDGQPLQAGDYYYVIKMPDLTELKGSVRILR